ncbi:MAG: hypothetical protein ACT4PE_18495 [Candidatus Eiseniibacteriota bacterium]
MFSKAFRVLAALLVAVPLGVGGLCCCLLGAPDAHRHAAAPTALAPCCADENTPAAPRPGPADDEDCSCPSRDAGVLAASVPAEGAAPTAPACVAVTVVPTVESILAGPAGLSVRTTPYPPPKVPAYRTLCAILC